MNATSPKASSTAPPRDRVMNVTKAMIGSTAVIAARTAIRRDSSAIVSSRGVAIAIKAASPFQ